jgi:hypothetical protein
MRLSWYAAAVLAVAGAGALGTSPLWAQDATPPITVELNKLEPADQACRLFLLLQNHSDQIYDALTLELVSFDKDGLIGQRLAVDLAPVRAQKTSVRLFDLPDTSCDAIGRVLLNDVSACSVGGAVVDACLDRLQVSSRGPVSLFK